MHSKNQSLVNTAALVDITVQEHLQFITQLPWQCYFALFIAVIFYL